MGPLVMHTSASCGQRSQPGLEVVIIACENLYLDSPGWNVTYSFLHNILVLSSHTRVCEI